MFFFWRLDSRWIMLMRRGVHYKGELLHLAISVSRWRAFNTADITTCHVPYIICMSQHLSCPWVSSGWNLLGSFWDLPVWEASFVSNAAMICLGRTEKASTHHLFSRFFSKEGLGVAFFFVLLLLEAALLRISIKKNICKHVCNIYIYYYIFWCLMTIFRIYVQINFHI